MSLLKDLSVIGSSIFKISKEIASTVTYSHWIDGIPQLSKDKYVAATGPKKEKADYKPTYEEVPSSSFQRAWGFGKLGAKLATSTISSSMKTGFKGDIKEHAMSDHNIDYLTKTLLKMRGAALKLGQFLSFQDQSMFSAKLLKALEQSRSKADAMPDHQLKKVLTDNLGEKWETRFNEFNTIPFAAASIGQVHKGRVEGVDVAVKIQFPGVEQSIDSDLNNMYRLVTWTNILPKALYFDVMIQHIREELIQECNYSREAEFLQRFWQLFRNDKRYKIPKLYKDFSTRNIITTEFMQGTDLEEIAEHGSQDLRDEIGSRLLELVIKEIFDFKFMQTDPNPGNFLYDLKNDQLVLLDFGACMTYDDNFIKDYFEVVYGASIRNRQMVYEASKRLKYLTGEETALMLNAHLESIFVIGDPLKYQGNFDFGNQSITTRMADLIPIMGKHRLSPPPPETYTLHRKLSGIYLLCIKLKAKVPAREIFFETTKQYKK